MINICYTGDFTGWFGMEASIYSLLTHTKGVNLYIISMQYERPSRDNSSMEVYNTIENWQKDKLIKIVKYLDPKSNITFLDGLQYYMDYISFGINENDGHSSPYAALRLLFDKFFPYLDHILYLDADTIIQDDLNYMYYHYLEEISKSKYCYAGFTNYLENARGELVGGVLLFDLIKCQQHNFFVKARNNLNNNYYVWYDQSAMEATEKYVELPATYNYMRPYEHRVYEPVILHFTSQLSPKVYLDPLVFYKKYPHLQYIKDGTILIDKINLEV